MRCSLLLPFALLGAFGCSESTVSPTAQSDGPTMQASVGSQVVHRASAGGPDVCSGVGDKPGCDANFSLIANQYSNGSARGHWVDRSSQVNGGGSFVVAVNCLNVIGNRAYISGVVTQGNSDIIGQNTLVVVVDNGVSANDPPDQITTSFIFPGVPDCNGAPALDDVIDARLHAMPQGQVVVR